MTNHMGDGVLMNVGVYVGRFNPLHKGHVRTLEQMVLNHPRLCLLMIGSCNAPLGLRNLFTYRERRDFIRLLYPNLRIVPLADYPSDDDWFSALTDLVEAAFPFYHRVNLYCGDVADISTFQHQEKVTVQVVDRYEEQVYSATEVRHALMMDQRDNLVNLLPPQLVQPVYDLGRQRLEELLRGEK